MDWLGHRTPEKGHNEFLEEPRGGEVTQTEGVEVAVRRITLGTLSKVRLGKGW